MHGWDWATLRGLNEQSGTLLDLSTECQLLADLSSCGRFGMSTTPHGWDSSALCYDLQCATKLIPIQSMNQGRGKNSLQARCYELLSWTSETYFETP